LAYGGHDADALVVEYGEILDSLWIADVASSASMVRDITDDLATLEIIPWSRGCEYYRSHSAILGVLTTAIRLSLGAPFGYNVLKTLASLRDPVREKIKADEEQKRKADKSGETAAKEGAPDA
jgi:hypothetical protein